MQFFNYVMRKGMKHMKIIACNFGLHFFLNVDCEYCSFKCPGIHFEHCLINTYEQFLLNYSLQMPHKDQG